MADWQLPIGMDVSAKEMVYAFICQNTTRKTSSHMHTNWDQCPQKAITVSLCDYLRHYTLLYCIGLWLCGHIRTTEYQPNRWRNARGEVCRKERIKFGFQNRKSNCAIFVILAFKSIECFFLAFAFRISFYRSFCISTVRIGVAMICKMYTVLPFSLIISSHYLNMFLIFLSLYFSCISQCMVCFSSICF